MEKNMYGVGTRNRFDLYCDDDVEDPFEILKQQEAELLKRKGEKSLKDKSKSVVPKAPHAVSKVKKVDPATKVTASILKMEDKTSKMSSKLDKPGNISDKNRKNIEKPPAVPEGKWKEEPKRGRSGFIGGRGISRGRGSGDGFDLRGKREFDRLSGSNKSGVKPIEKRDGGGAHNWGTMKDDMQFEEAPDTEERSSDEALISAFESISVDPALQEKKSDEEIAMTLDEWKQKEQSKRSVPTYNLRKPGEGEDHGKKWGKVYMLKKKEPDDDYEEDEFEDDEGIKRGRQKQRLDIEICFDAPARGRGRGRGFGQSSRGRSVHSEANIFPSSNVVPQHPAPKVDDLNDFPLLPAT